MRALRYLLLTLILLASASASAQPAPSYYKTAALYLIPQAGVVPRTCVPTTFGGLDVVTTANPAKDCLWMDKTGGIYVFKMYSGLTNNSTVVGSGGGGGGSPVTLTLTSPVVCDGGASCTLDQNRTLALQLGSVTPSYLSGNIPNSKLASLGQFTIPAANGFPATTVTLGQANTFDLVFSGDGSGHPNTFLSIGAYGIPYDPSIGTAGAGQDQFVMTFDNPTHRIFWKASGSGSGAVSSVGVSGGGLSISQASPAPNISLKLNAGGGLSKILGVGADELGIASAGVTNAMLAGSITNAKLQNPSLTLNTAGFLIGGGVVALGSALTITCPTCIGSSQIGSVVQAWNAQLDALAALNTTGYTVRLGPNSFVSRTFVADAGIILTNEDGLVGATHIGNGGVTSIVAAVGSGAFVDNNTGTVNITTNVRSIVGVGIGVSNVAGINTLTNNAIMSVVNAQGISGTAVNGVMTFGSAAGGDASGNVGAWVNTGMQGTAVAAMTTKGDTWTKGATIVRHPAPADASIMVADSTQTDGWRNDVVNAVKIMGVSLDANVASATDLQVLCKSAGTGKWQACNPNANGLSGVWNAINHTIYANGAMVQDTSIGGVFMSLQDNNQDHTPDPTQSTVWWRGMAPDNTTTKDNAQTLTNKTLTTPTIASFTNATHNHQNAAGGGQLNAGSVFSAGTVPTANGGLGTTAPTANGQFPIGKSDGTVLWGLITAGANITLTPAANGLTIAASGSGGASLSAANSWLAVQTYTNAGRIRINNSADTFYSELTSAATANRVWTIPDATDTGVGKATTDTLTNKTLTAPVIAGATSSGSTAFDLSGSTGTFLTSTGAVTVGPGAVSVTGNVTMAPAAVATGAPAIETITGAADTNQTASTDKHTVFWNLARTVQFATGAKAAQSEVFIDRPTYTAVGSTTCTNCSTVTIVGAPVASTNMTITERDAFWVQSGLARLDGGIIMATGQTFKVGSTNLLNSNATDRLNANAMAFASQVTGDIGQATDASNFQRLASVATGNAFISGGVGALNSWGKIGLGTHVSGTLPSANGGTNLDTSASTGIPKIVSGTWSVIAAVTAALGGTGIDTSGSTGVPKIAAGVWSVIAQLTAALGGTGVDSSAYGHIPTINAGTWAEGNIVNKSVLCTSTTTGGAFGDCDIITLPSGLDSLNTKACSLTLTVALKDKGVGGGTVAITAGSSHGGTDALLSQTVTAGTTANGTNYGQLSAGTELGTLADSTRSYNLIVDGGVTLSVRTAAPAGTVSTAVKVRAMVLGECH